MDTQNKLGYFGYGSLVNPDARSPNALAVPAKVAGWVRQWRHCTSSGDVNLCALTVQRRFASEIEGLLLVDDSSALADVDRRETNYRREHVEITEASSVAIPKVTDTFLYVSNQPRWADPEFPILRTYLDCVISGYLRTFGYDGAMRFVETTEGWDCPILDDRRKPLYPRAVQLTREEAEAIDQLLQRVRSIRKVA